MDVHVKTNVTTRVESHGQRITSPIAVSDDIDGDIRWGETGYTGTGAQVDIGADEFNGITIDDSPPAITYTPLANSTSLTGATLSNVTIYDPLTGVNTSTAKPRLYYKKASNANTYVDNSSTTDGWKYAEATQTSSPYSFNVDFSLLYTGSAVTGDTIQYFLIAQDNVSPIANVGGDNAVFTSAPTSTNLVAANFPLVSIPKKFNVAFPLSGTYYVGVNETYKSLTSAIGGFFNFVNANVLTGDVTVMIKSNLTETGAIQLNPLAMEGVGGYKLTIVPSTDSLRTLTSSATGSFIKMMGVSNVIFDGSFSGHGRYLKLYNSSSSGSGPQFDNGANNCAVKNCIILGASTASNYGINISSGNVNNLVLDNNDISYYQYGIYESGSTTAINNNLTITNNILGSEVDATSLGYGGINLTGYCNGVNISNNVIKNILVGNAPYGIYLNTAVKNVTISNNNIHRVMYTGTGGYGGFGIILNTADTASNINIINNVIYKIYGDGWYGWSTTDEIVGIHIYGTMGGVKLYNNSINMFGGEKGYNTTTTNAAIYVSATANNIDVRNNIIKNTITNPANAANKSYVIYCAGPKTVFSNIDYNIYYTSGSQGVLGYLGTADVTNLANWKIATSQDAHSMFVNPLFTDTNNLVPTKCPTSPAIGTGTQLAAVTSDIVNVQRSQFTPTIGAYELGYAKTLNVSAFMQEYYAGHGLPMNQTLDMDMNTGDMFTKYQTPIVDLVQIQIINPSDLSVEYQYDDYNLNQDGTITPEISLPSNMTGSRYIVINHRNSIETWSDSIDFTCLAVNYNFYTHPISLQFPSNMFVDSLNNIYYGSLIWGGDVGYDLAYPSRDGIINIFDLSSVFDAINDPSGMYSAGYIAQDLNGDGVVNIYDLSLVFDNLNAGASSINPNTMKKKK